MKQKTKSILAAIAMVATPVAGLAGVGVGIGAFTQLPHPYHNQWIDFTKEQFKPIVSTVDNDFVKQSLKIDRPLTEEDVKSFYIDRLTKTKEIFVEDFLNKKERDYWGGRETGVGSYDKMRISDLSVTLDKVDKTKASLSYAFSESFEGFGTVNNENAETKRFDGTVKMTSIPLLIKHNSNESGELELDFEDRNGEAIYNINKCDGAAQGQITWINQHVDYNNYKTILIDPGFRDVKFTSRYLSNVKIEN